LTGLAIIVGTIVLVQHLSLKPPHTHASIPPAQSPALTLPDKPSIAVLPFINMSGDHEREYFSDGITDDLITDLSRLPGLFVIARNSTFTYKGKAAKLQDVGRELGVRYVLEGSVRKAAGQVRITVQLADATTGAELWAERYDRPLRDVFALQDEIVRKIVTTLNLQLALAQQGILIPRTTENLEAYDDLLRGTEYLASLTKDGDAKARPMFEKAIELDPKYAAAYALLGLNYFQGRVLAFDPDPNAGERALKMEQQALALDDSLSLAHSILAAIYVQKGQNDQALTEAQRGIALDPNSASGYFWLADVLNLQSKAAEALAAAEKAIRLDPRNRDNYLWEQGWALTELGQCSEAIPALKRYLARYPYHLWAHARLANDYSFIGDDDAARAETAQIEKAVALSPDSASGYATLAYALIYFGKPTQALVAADTAIRLDPRNRVDSSAAQGYAYILLGRPQEAIAPLKLFLARYPDNPWVHSFLASDYMELARDGAARAEVAEVHRLDPQLTVDMIFPTASLDHKAFPAAIDRVRADLRKAGLK
jgi:TolB-like protein/predicted Zn-dependent protease